MIARHSPIATPANTNMDIPKAPISTISSLRYIGYIIELIIVPMATAKINTVAHRNAFNINAIVELSK